MSVLAIIPCLNEAANINQLLQQFLGEDIIDMIVVADGGSNDGSREIVGRYAQSSDRVHLLDNPDRIQSAGVNLAVRRFGTDFHWLVRIDAHCEYPIGFVKVLVEAAATSGASAVTVPMITKGRAGFQIAVAAAQNSILGTGGSAHRHQGKGRYVDHGHHALIDRKMFQQIGGYCEAMPCNEDAEFDHRQALAGGRIWLEPLATITYFPRSTPVALWRQYFRYGVGRARTVRRHRIKMRLRQVVPLAVPAALVLAPLAAIHWVFAVPATIWFSICMLGGVMIGLRRGGGWAILAGIPAAIMHVAWALGFITEILFQREPLQTRYGFQTSAGRSDEPGIVRKP